MDGRFCVTSRPATEDEMLAADEAAKKSEEGAGAA
jgi:hypothetical protein